ncbi:flagellar motor switch protein FliM [Georgenia sp. H159]|uniref:flagellar motor switch protein FliM n=1 Tax=Georgenia sp. H159 TaxID=3076115 RepID=UPI002D78C1C6|nr:flagellar motor switch protein FliM [Georgenia sp. H159]
MTVRSSPPAGGPPVVYDFRRPMTLAREHARVLEVALGTFSRQWANQLLASLRVSAQVTLESIAMCAYEEYISSLPARTTMVVCAVGPNRRPGLVQFPLDTSLTWVDHMLGGRGVPDSVPERDLTEMEQLLIGDLMGKVLADLDYAFSGIAAVDAELRRIQHTPQLLQATAASTAVITATFTILVEDHSVTATLMLPAEGLLASLRERESVETRSAEEVETERMQRELLDRAVQQSPVEVAVRLGPIPIHPREVVHLSVGDLVPLHHPSALPLDVVVGDRVLAQAVAGTNGSRLAGLVVNVKENS